MTSSVADLAKRPAAGPRPDRSPEAIARRRELHRASLADGALEGCYPDPAAARIAELWILGEISSSERIELIAAFLRTQHNG